MNESTGVTKQGDELLEWQDEDVSPPQHHVYIGREARSLPDLIFHFGSQDEAHALFLALCRASAVYVEGEQVQASQGDPSCEQCHGQGCSQCNDAIYYAQEDAAEQWRRDRRIDASHVYGVEF